MVPTANSISRAVQGKRNRRRGADGERELARLLREHLGDSVVRNLQQSRDGGTDLQGIPFALEVKRSTLPKIPAWWKQTCVQSVADGTRPPCLAYRIDRHDWRFVLPLGVIHSGFEPANHDLTIEMGLKEFVAIVQEKIAHLFLETPQWLMQSEIL